MTPVEAALAFASLLVVVNPVALAPVFGALTRDMAPAEARRTALVAVTVGCALIGAAGVAGHAALRALGAEMALAHLVVAAALLAIGLMLALGRGALPTAGGGGHRSPALVPLAVPLIAGPGAMGAMVLFAGKYGAGGGLPLLYALLAAVGATTYAAFLAAGSITRRLGARGVGLITRGLGVVLIGAAARFLVEGLRDYGVLAT